MDTFRIVEENVDNAFDGIGGFDTSGYWTSVKLRHEMTERNNRSACVSKTPLFKQFFFFGLCVMADPKRLKPTRNGGKKKKKTAAKQALKKKQLSSKSRNDELREVLDRQAQSLYPVCRPHAMISNGEGNA